MGLYRVEGLVLRSRELGEADRLVTFYTRSDGKLRAVARGSRRPRSRLMGATQPFCHGQYLLMEGRELDVISQAELVGHSLRPLREDLPRMVMASLTAELVDALVEERAASEPLFEALLAAWEGLARARPEQVESVAWWFELRLLALLGYGPVLGSCAACSRPVGASGGVPFSAREGGLLCGSCRARDPLAPSLSPTALMVLRGLDATPDRPRGYRPSAGVAREVRQALGGFLEYHLPSRPHSMGMVQALAEDEETWRLALTGGGGASERGGGASES